MDRLEAAEEVARAAEAFIARYPGVEAYDPMLEAIGDWYETLPPDSPRRLAPGDANESNKWDWHPGWHRA